MAAVYDHALVTQALERGYQVAFFAIEGNLSSGAGARREIEVIAESIYGVRKGSARVSIESAVLSVAFDPRRTSLTAAQTALERKLATKKLWPHFLRVMERSANL